MTAYYYVRNETTGERWQHTDLRAAKLQGAALARQGFRTMVCRASSRIVCAWDNGKRSI